MNDLISRQAAIDAADRADYTGLAIEEVKKVTDEVVKELKQLSSAQPDVPDINVGNMISRQAAIEAIGILLEQSENDEHDKTWNNAIRSSINAVKHHLPSAQPEIIDCKECSRYSNGYCHHPETYSMYVDANHFCGYAERRTDSDGRD